MKYLKSFNENSTYDIIEDDNILKINRELTWNHNNLTAISGRTIDPYTYPSLKENLVYVDTYIKGKRTKKVEDLRIRMKGVDSGEECMVYLSEDRGVFLNYTRDINDQFDGFKRLDGENHLKHRSYNYYITEHNTSDVLRVLNGWKSSENAVAFDGDNGLIKDKIGYEYLFEYNGQKF